MLDDRKASILRAVVQEYIETAQPVGSGRVASAPGVDVSSATVRNEMAVARDRGLPRPAPHQRRSHPHREGLPLLRRHHRRARCAPRRPGPAGQLVLPGRPRRDRGDARGHQPPAVGPHRVDRRGRPAAQQRHARPLDPPRRPRAPATAGRRRCSATPRSRSTPSSSTVEVGEERINAAVGPPVGAPGQRHAGAPCRRPSRRPATTTTDRGRVRRARRAARRSHRGRDVGRRLRRAARPGSRRRSTPSRRCSRSSTCSSSSSSSSRCSATWSTGACKVAIGSETGMETLADAALVVAPYTIDGERAGSIGVLGPGPHELSRGAGRRGRREQPTRNPPDRGLIRG